MRTRRHVLQGLATVCSCLVAGGSGSLVGMPGGSQKTPWEVVCAGAGTDRFGGVPETFAPDREALEIVRRMARSAGLTPDFIVRKGRFTDSSTAIAARRGTRLYIIYDQAKFKMLGGHVPWEDLGILAHEIGHHVHSHFLTGGSRPPKELIADKYAGFCCARMGATREQALSWTRKVNKVGSRTHPPRDERVEAVIQGWQDAQFFHRWQETAHCEPNWMGPEVQVGDRTCRVARQCLKDGPEVRLACENSLGDWTWAR